MKNVFLFFCQGPHLPPTGVPGGRMYFAAHLWNTESLLSVAFSDLYLTTIPIKQNACVPHACCSLHTLIIGLYTLPPVMPAPSASGIIIHFLLSPRVWPRWQGSRPSVSVLLAPKVSAGSYPWHGSLVVRVMSLSGLSTSNSCRPDLILTRLRSPFSKKCAQRRRSLQNTLVSLVFLSCLFSVLPWPISRYTHKLLESKKKKRKESRTSPKVGTHALAKIGCIRWCNWLLEWRKASPKVNRQASDL